MIASAIFRRSSQPYTAFGLAKASGHVTASVMPEQVPLDDPLATCDGATSTPALAAGASVILFQMDVLHGLTLSELHPDAETTAYGPLADFVTIARGQDR